MIECITETAEDSYTLSLLAGNMILFLLVLLTIFIIGGVL